MSNFGQRLKRVRTEKKLTQKELAEIFNVSESAIGMYERNEREPNFDLINKFSDFFNVKPSYFVDDNQLKESSVSYIINKPDIYPVGELINIPIVAEIPCGEPTLTEDNILGYEPVDTSLVNLNGGEYVWLRARGESMINAGIFDGSLVLIRLQPEVENGQIAAVCLDNENATLKRLYKNEGEYTLVPEHPTMKRETYPKSRLRIVGMAIKVQSELK